MRLSRTIGPSHNVGEADTLAIKTALNRLGLYSIPSYGQTPYPDEAMFDGIKAVQRQLGLWPSGIMRPDGLEHQAITTAMASQQAKGGAGGHGSVHVRAYSQDRDGHLTQVQAHERSAPGSGPDTPVRESPPPMTNPVPGGKIRGTDGYGDGHFGAYRMHGPHEGVDIVVQPGQTIASPTDGTIVRTDVLPYGKGSPYRGIEIKSASGHRIKMFYVTPGLPVGTKVKAGDPIAKAQDISKEYPPNKRGVMTPHVHVEVRNKNGGLIDPAGMVSGSR